MQALHKSTRWCVVERSQIKKKTEESFNSVTQMLHAVTITVPGSDAAHEMAEGAPMQEQQCIG